MNKIRPEIPKEIKISKQTLYSSTILRNSDIILTVYQGKPSKSVLLLSSVHNTVNVTDTAKKIPESVAYY